jgi:hypothetical protein
MTDREKAIVMAYTGVCMLSGDKFKIFHEYVENIMGRPVYTHEMAIKAVDDEIKEKAKTDFITLCAEQEPKRGHWQKHTDASGNSWYACPLCHNITYSLTNYCSNCGCSMI